MRVGVRVGTRPCVAQRVWPMPVAPSGGGSSRPRRCVAAGGSSTACTLPPCRSRPRARPSRSPGTPGAGAPVDSRSRHSRGPTYPLIPHIGRSSLDLRFATRFARSRRSPGDSLRPRRLDHHAHHRLGAGRANQHAALALQPWDSYSTAAHTAWAPSMALRSRTRTLTSHCGSFSIAPRSARSAAPRAPPGSAGRRRVPSPAGTKPVSMMCPDCSPPEGPAAPEQLGQHVAIAHRRSRHLDAGVAHRAVNP